MKGLSLSIVNIIDIFIPISFYACIVGTICIAIILLLSTKVNKIIKPLKTLVLTFCILWLLNIFANFYYIIANPTGINLTAKGNRIFKDVQPGTVALSKDTHLGAKNYTVKIPSGVGDTEMLLWDFAVEDGDYVQVYVDGTALTDPILLKNKAQRVWIPAGTTQVQIKGTKDGSGGITCTVQFPATGDTYFNEPAVNGTNTYTLTK